MITLLITLGMFGAFFDAIYGNHKVEKIKFGRNKLGIIFLFRAVCTLCKDIMILTLNGAKGLFVFSKSLHTKANKVKPKSTKTNNAKVINLNDYKRSKVG